VSTSPTTLYLVAGELGSTCQTRIPVITPTASTESQWGLKNTHTNMNKYKHRNMNKYKHRNSGEIRTGNTYTARKYLLGGKCKNICRGRGDSAKIFVGKGGGRERGRECVSENSDHTHFIDNAGWY